MRRRPKSLLISSGPAFLDAIALSLVSKIKCAGRAVLLQLRTLSGRKIPKIHIIGGGAQNKLLNQLCANFTRCEVDAGPIEATALGNLAMQMIALGEIASLQQARAMIADSFPVERYTPVPDSAINQNWARFQALP
jgi:rhamnulokinase